MLKNLLEDEIIKNIKKDNLEEFIEDINQLGDWETYLLIEEQESLLHYSISNL
jgi:hypothetical protein